MREIDFFQDIGWLVKLGDIVSRFFWFLRRMVSTLSETSECS